ncbi:RDD family protein [Mucilaginibacter flavidus]|uniref:RDD family protein n=1 Tax=Mucilaginibacter flavidus TaxID=2949309 RepID=UPI002092CD7C|nr:RDD family protein [Mucilaginibacter flavidus]MCO5949440.1 RDD family protein [Mucilaginibacter flavidus]
MPSPIDFNAVKKALNSKTSLQLIDILSFTQDDYDPAAIPIIEEILIERGVPKADIVACENSYGILKTNIENQPEKHQYANFWPRCFNYVIDHIICYGTVSIIAYNVPFTYQQTNLYYGYAFAVYVSYYAIFLGLFNATPGMLIFGLTVVYTKSKKPINFFMGFVRGVFMVLNFITFSIGHLIMLGDKNKQTLVDKMSDTSVVYR